MLKVGGQINPMQLEANSVSFTFVRCLPQYRTSMEGHLRCGRHSPACCACSVRRTRRTGPFTVSCSVHRLPRRKAAVPCGIRPKQVFTIHSDGAGVTLASFVLALVFFTSELLLFKTVSWKMALQPMIVAGATMW